MARISALLQFWERMLSNTVMGAALAIYCIRALNTARYPSRVPRWPYNIELRYQNQRFAVAINGLTKLTNRMTTQRVTPQQNRRNTPCANAAVLTIQARRNVQTNGRRNRAIENGWLDGMDTSRKQHSSTKTTTMDDYTCNWHKHMLPGIENTN